MDIYINPSDNPQEIIDNAPENSTIIFTDGIHQHGFSRNDTMIQIDKPLKIHIQSAAILKVSNNSMLVNKHAELITNFHADNPILSLDIDSLGYTLGETVRTYEIRIDGIGNPNTFHYQIRDFNNTILFTSNFGIPVTGGFQDLADGIKIKFPQTTGYLDRAGCIIAVGSKGYSVIRIGSGTHQNYIDGVEFSGNGVIDQNQTNNAYSNLYATNLNVGLLIHGRVSNFYLEDRFRFRNCNRSIIAIGENVGGTYNYDGTVTGGTSYDVVGLTIKKTITENSCISGVLFGMPNHRGITKHIDFSDNEISCSLTAIEPNNLCEEYSIFNNRIYTPSNTPIHCWRYSKNGVIENNKSYLFGASDIVVSGAPSGWKLPENIRINNNYNLYTSTLG